MDKVYGDRLIDFFTDKIDWRQHSSDILERSVSEINKTDFNISEIKPDYKLFKEHLIQQWIGCQHDVLIYCSHPRTLLQYWEDIKSFLSSSGDNRRVKYSARILIPSCREASVFLKEVQSISNSNPEIEINTITASNVQCFFSIIDEKLAVFSEVKSGERKRKPDYFNIITGKDSIIWNCAAIFESLWKQSVLESKVHLLNTKLTDNDKLNQNVMRIIAHELKNPIQPILGFSEMMRSNPRLSVEQKNDLLKIISRNARKLDLLTDNILDYARLENGIFNLNLEHFDLIKVVKDLISDYQFQTLKRDIKFVLKYSENPFYIEADKVRLTEVLDNLLSNSLKFTEKGRINISILNNKNFLHLEVKDTGTGIPDENFDKLFSKFFTTDKLGTGLGLYLSKIIIDKHHGKIGAYNNEKQGCTFYIHLPISHNDY